MNEVARVEKMGGFRRLLALAGAMAPGASLRILENPNEEIDHALARTGKLPKLYAAGGGVVGRVEENYLYSTRRFPNLGNNTIGAGAVTVGDYNFFSFGFGDAGGQAGYSATTVPQLTYQQTNMASGGAIPNGRGFRMFDLGVSFNSRAKADDIAQLLDTSHLTFDKQGSALVIRHGPMIYWPGGVGLSGFAAAATTATTTTINVGGATNGLASLSNTRRFKTPRVLNANEKFMYILSNIGVLANNGTAIALSDFVEVRIGLFGQVLDAIAQ